MPPMILVSSSFIISPSPWSIVAWAVRITNPRPFSVSAGKSALHWAAAVNNVEAAVVLLKNGANKDMQDNKVCKVI